MSGKILEPTKEHIERLAIGVVVGFNPEGLFVFEFLKPILTVVVDEEERIKGLEGESRPDVRIYMPPRACKRFLKALEDMIRKYEERFGEIKIEEEEE